MKRLPNKQLTEQQLDILLQNVLSEGSEGIICQGEDPNTISKLFFGENRDTAPNIIHKKEELTEMSDNKHSKIKLLFQEDLEGLVHPINSISYNGVLLGYEMQKEQAITLLDYFHQKNPTRDERIFLLKLARQRLEYFARKGIIYGDVATRNILVNKNNSTNIVTYCDIDNIQIGPYPIDLVPRDAREYAYKRGIDEKLDAYMHNCMIIPALRLNYELIDFYYMPELIPYEFFEEAAKTILSMEEPTTFTGKYLIDHVKTTLQQQEYLKTLRGK